MPRFSPEARKANQTVVDLLGRIAAAREATPTQIALTADELGDIENAVSAMSFQGARYPEAAQRLIDR